MPDTHPSPVGYESRPGVSEKKAPMDHFHAVKVEDWKNLTLENAWVYYDTAFLWAYPQYLLDPSGFVHIKAAIKDGTTTDVTLLTTLPVGYQPAQSLPILGFNSTNGLVTLNINPDGSIYGLHGLDAGFTIFSAIFEADRNRYVQSRS